MIEKYISLLVLSYSTEPKIVESELSNKVSNNLQLEIEVLVTLNMSIVYKRCQLVLIIYVLIYVNENEISP